MANAQGSWGVKATRATTLIHVPLIIEPYELGFSITLKKYQQKIMWMLRLKIMYVCMCVCVCVCVCMYARGFEGKIWYPITWSNGLWGKDNFWASSCLQE